MPSPAAAAAAAAAAGVPDRPATVASGRFFEPSLSLSDYSVVASKFNIIIITLEHNSQNFHSSANEIVQRFFREIEKGQEI